MRFTEQMLAAAQEEALAGRIVLLPTFFGHADGTLLTEEVTAVLGELHRRRIDLADDVLIVAPGRCTGGSTARELRYAAATGKPHRLRLDP